MDEQEGTDAPKAPNSANKRDEPRELGPLEETSEGLAEPLPALALGQYSEVTITRRLFRDGTSSYYLNQTPCRLRDITDFFLGTGVGTKAYSIIEQGRVGMIVSSRPTERRHLIDEAAGITRFKRKKRAAERKLEQTRHNLLRVTDLVAELGKRIGSLKRQAQKAERYRRYKAEVKEIELTQASQRYLELMSEEHVFASEAAKLTNKLQHARQQFAVAETNITTERAAINAEAQRLSGWQESVWDLENRVKLTENKIEYQHREAHELDERVATARRELLSVGERKVAAELEIQEHKNEFASAEEAVATAQTRVDDNQRTTAETRATLTKARSELEDTRSQLADARTNLVRLTSLREFLSHRGADSRRRLDRVVEDTTGLNQRSTELEKQLKKSRAALAELVQTRLDLGTQAKDFEQRSEELKQRVVHSEAEVETLRTETHRRRSRLQSLEEIQNKYEGFARGTRAVMQAANEVTAKKQEIRGLVADFVNAPANLEVAVEAALGDSLGGIVVESAAVGVQAIDYLKRTSAGRSAFVPFLDPRASVTSSIEVEDRSSSPEAGSPPKSAARCANTPENLRRPLAAEEGVLGVMTELVDFTGELSKIADALVGEYVVVDTLERAISLHDRGVDHSLVTLEGDVVDARGVVAGGSRDSQGAGVLAQKREIRDLQEIVGALEGDLATASTRLLQTKQELSKIEATLKSTQNERHDGELQITAHQKDRVGAQSELAHLRAQKQRLNSEELTLRAQLEDVDSDAKRALEDEKQATLKAENLDKEQLALIQKVVDGQTAFEEKNTELTESRVVLAQLGEKRAALEASVLRLENEHGNVVSRLGKLESEICEHSERSQMLRQECHKLTDELQALSQEHQEKSARLAEGRQAYEKRIATLNHDEIALREIRAQVEKLTSDANALAVKLSAITQNRTHLIDGVHQHYGIDLPRHLGDYHQRPLVGPAEENHLAELRRLIARMGSDINLLAIDEYAETSERYQFLSTQQKDLESAVDQLKQAIDKINQTSRQLFRETFHAINSKFRQVFPRLFRGGCACLSLTGGDDLDILEAGVEIMAQPPGKKNSTVDQLSGGEKALTAVALIFAIFQVKPSPFCLLDEVDAPLDDVNVDRYNEFVREITDRSQFIVITHNKRTMEIMDRLYGVTMQEPGSSHVVAVDLTKINDALAA